ncbi:MAG: hypothetical protein JNL74_07235 [Fibrobacteres bacterium]|nr:hypothetical protein [Fibrobacterota bacterium]
MKKILSLITVSAVSISLMAGCAKSTEADNFNAKDGSAAYIASEINDMGTSALETPAPAKMAVAEDGQVTIVKSWTYIAEKKVFVREVNVTYPAGVRNRVDSVWFMGSSLTDTLESVGSTTTRPSIDQIYNIHHKRISSRSWNDLSADVELDMMIVLSKTPTDSSMTKTGKIVKSRTARILEQDWNATITGVKRLYSAKTWSLPVSGTVHIDRTTTNTRNGRSFDRTIDITYQSDSTATVSVTRSYDKERVDFTVDFKTSTEGVEK